MTARTDRRIALIVGAVLRAFFTVCSAVQVAGWTDRLGRAHLAPDDPRPRARAASTPARATSRSCRRPATTSRSTAAPRARCTRRSSDGRQRREREVDRRLPEITFGHCGAESSSTCPTDTAVNVTPHSGDLSATGLSALSGS